MDKKELLLKLLEELKDSWEDANTFLEAIKKGQLTKNQIDMLIDKIVYAINNLNIIKGKEKINKTKKIIEQIKKIESNEKKEEEKEIDNILNNL